MACVLCAKSLKNNAIPAEFLLSVRVHTQTCQVGVYSQNEDRVLYSPVISVAMVEGDVVETVSGAIRRIEPAQLFFTLGQKKIFVWFWTSQKIISKQTIFRFRFRQSKK